MPKINARDKGTCSKKGCSNPGEKEAGGGYKGRYYYYCNFHHRIKQMRSSAKIQGKKVPSITDLESMLIEAVDSGCKRCGKAMTLTSNDNNTKRDTASLQHNLDGSIEICCHSCNSRHGHHSLGDFFWRLSDDDQYCSDCKSIKKLKHFNKNTRNFTGKQSLCRECQSVRKKNYYQERKFLYA